MPAKYQLYKDKAGKYRFRLVAENGRNIVFGEAYERRKSCLNGIESVGKNRGSAIEDTTIDSPKIPFPKYQILLDKAGEYRFNLSASNGEIIAISEGYSSKKSCLNGIETVRRIGNSEIEDLTSVTGKQEVTSVEPVPAAIEKEVETLKQVEPEGAYKEAEKEISMPATEKLEETQIELEPAVTQKEAESPKQVEFEEAYKEEEKKIPIPPVAVTAPKETAVYYDEEQNKRKGISGIAVVVLIIGLVVGLILVAISLGFGDFFGGAADAVAKAVVLSFGLLIICASILLFFAKK